MTKTDSLKAAKKTRKVISIALVVVFVLAIIINCSAVTAQAAGGIKIGVSSSVSSQYAGAKVTVKATASAGTAPYYYKFMYKLGSGNWVVVRNYSTSNSATFTASSAGTYTVRSYAKDKVKREIYCDLKITIKARYFSPSNTSSISSTNVRKGQTVTVRGNATGGTQPYSFKYYYTDQQGNQTVVKNHSTTRSVTIRFNNAGYYAVRSTLKDKDGKVLDRTFNVTVTNNTGQTLSNSSWLSTYNVYTGGSITINGRASGGNQPYNYIYYYSQNGASYKKIAGYTTSSKQNYKFTSPGFYRIKVIAKDLSGKTSETVKNITVKQNTNKTLSLNASVNTTSLVDQNTIVTISASGAGGVLPYTYAYYYKVHGAQWKQINGFSSSTRATLKLTGRGTYSLKSIVKDSSGATKERTCYVTSVTKLNNSDITENVDKDYGLTAEYTIKDAGNNATYEVYYRDPGSSQWVILQNYCKNKNLKLRPRYLGVTAYRVNTKLNGNVTTTNFKITTSIPNTAYQELELLNAERKKAGLSQLKIDSNLVFVANVRAEEIQRSYSHTRPDGRNCFTVIEEYGIRTPSVSGENIAWGYPDVKTVMTGWMNSSKHKENILNSRFTKVGIGINGKYWTQMFTS